jgi:hypothetical protein
MSRLMHPAENRLMKEEADGNWLYSIDGLAPLEILYVFHFSKIFTN